jgi:ligand-binding sensor domain-containing protein
MKIKTVLKKGFIIFLLIFNRALSQEIAERTIHYRPGDWISFPVTRFVTSIALGYQYTYFGTVAGISRYEFFREEWDYPFTVSDGLENGNIRLVAFDFNTSYLWCVTESGVSFRIPGAEEWRNIFYFDLGVGSVSSLGTGREHIWLYGDGNFLKGDPTTGFFQSATSQEESQDDVQWTGRLDRNRINSLPDLFVEGSYLFFPEGYIQDINLRQYNITGSLQDKFDNLWLATWGLGCGVADMKSFFMKMLPSGPYSPDISAMAWDEGGMWMGGQHGPEVPGGITWWDMERGDWIYFESRLLSSLRSDEITSIVSDTNFVWFGTLEGLAQYDKNSDTWRTFSTYDNLWHDHVTSVVLGEGCVWVGTVYGINRISLPDMIVEQVRDTRMIHRYIYQLEADNADVWAGTDIGIYRYSGEKGVWEYCKGSPDIIARSVTAVSACGQEVWFGTDDGVEVYDKVTDEWKGFPVMHYPTQGPIFNILAVESAVWVGTDHGVLKYLREEEYWRRFTEEDGLIDNSVKWILQDGDYIWFGTGRGLTRFYWDAPYRAD